MEALITGRVVDSRGLGVCDARVLLTAGPQSMQERDVPAAAGTGPTGKYAFTTADMGFVDEHDETGVYRQGGVFALELSVRAVQRRYASMAVEFRWVGAPVELPNLVLEPGVMGRIAACKDDGAPARGAAIEVILLADEPPAHFHFEGIADEHGELAFGPVPARAYSVLVDAVCPHEPPQRARWDAHELHETLVVTLPEGRAVRGRVLTSKGAPAVGYRVAPAGLPIGDRLDLDVETDDDGGFELEGMACHGAVIAIYGPPPPLTSTGEDVDELEDLLEQLDSPPLQMIDVAPDETMPLSLILPSIGTLLVHLENTRGERIRSGHAFWFHADRAHNATSCAVDPGGVVRFENVALHLPFEIRVSIDDARQGKLEQRFAIPAADEEITLRVSGAGTVVLRLHPHGAPDRELRVRNCRARFHRRHTLARMEGWTSELRGWTVPRHYPSLEVEAPGFRKLVVEGIHVHDDAPTFLDIELEPQ